MKKAVIIAMLTTGGVCHAQGDLRADLNLVSDRLLRGFSMTNEEPSLIGALHYRNSGTHLGGVAFTNIQINNGTRETLLDAIAEHRFSIKSASLDVGYVRHIFTEVNDADSGEWYVGAIVENNSLHVYENNELEEQYIDFNGAYSLNNDHKVVYHVGKMDSKKSSQLDFTDYSVGLFRSVNGLTVGATYAHNNNDGLLEAVAGTHVVLSIATSW